MQPVAAPMRPNQTASRGHSSHVAQPPLSIHVDPLVSASSNNSVNAFDDHRRRVPNELGDDPAFSPHDLDALVAFDPLGAVDSPSTVASVSAGASNDAAARVDKKPAKNGTKTNKSKAGKAGGSGSNATDATTTKPARQRKVASAAKRARRSEIEKQSRQRRMGTVDHMRGELELLENEYMRLVKQQSETRGVIVHPREVEALRHKYLELSAEARAMRQEQKQLRVMLHERQLFHDSFRAMAVEYSDDDEFPWSAVAHASFEPLTAAKCFEIIRESYEVITRFEVGGNFISSGATYLGWADKRRLDEDTSSMHFTFTKRFANQSTEYLMEQSWKTFCNEDDMRKKVFSPAVQVNLEILQVINDDVCVVRRHTKYVSMGKAFHTVYLLFRIQTETGYTVGFRTIPAPGIQNSLEEHESWIDIFHWTHLTRLVDENGDARGCELVFGGSIGSEVMKFAMHWMLELAMTVVRWENACVAPMAIKPSAETLHRDGDMHEAFVRSMDLTHDFDPFGPRISTTCTLNSFKLQKSKARKPSILALPLAETFVLDTSSALYLTRFLNKFPLAFALSLLYRSSAHFENSSEDLKRRPPRSSLHQVTMADEGCDMIECCLCGALCGACCASAADDDDRRRRGHSHSGHRGGHVYVQPVVVQPQYAYQQQGYPPQGGAYPPQGYPPQGGAYPPQGYPPQGYPPQQGYEGYPPQQGYPPQGGYPGQQPAYAQPATGKI